MKGAALDRKEWFICVQRHTLNQIHGDSRWLINHDVQNRYKVHQMYMTSNVLLSNFPGSKFVHNVNNMRCGGGPVYRRIFLAIFRTSINSGGLLTPNLSYHLLTTVYWFSIRLASSLETSSNPHLSSQGVPGELQWVT